MTDPQHPADILFGLHEAHKRQQRQQPVAQPAPGAVQQPMGEDRATRYARKALDGELADLATASVGTRNPQLNKSAFSLGQLVGGGYLHEEDTRAALRHTALAVGLEPSEVDKTISSGIEAGKQHPRVLSVAPDPADRLGVPVSPAPAQQPEPPDAPPPEADEADAFWHSRDLLWHVHQSAKARRCSPWAVLGVVLARVATMVPTQVVLPPIVGGQASLNLFVGLVGPSGSGKGAAERVAAACLHVGYVRTLTTGSGEGIGHSYKTRKQGVMDWTDDQHAVLFSVPEIDTLAALGGRKGATLMPELRRAWSGEELGFAYADPSRRITIEAHQYRLCLVAGIQPARAGALLDDADGGTPQRFLWCTAMDPDAPDKAPECPHPRTWQPPDYGTLRADAFSEGRKELGVCQLARDTIDAAHLAARRGQGDPLDGHLLLSQLKAAAALAVLDGRLGVTDDDWHLADVLVRQSSATRSIVVQALKRASRAKNVGQAEAEAERALLVEDRRDEAAHKRVCRNVLRHLASGEWVAGSTLRNSIAFRDRGYFKPAVAALCSTGQIEMEGDEHRGKYRLA